MNSPTNPTNSKIKVDWEIDSELIRFISLLKKLEQKDNISDSVYVSSLLSFAIAKILRLENKND